MAEEPRPTPGPPPAPPPVPDKTPPAADHADWGADWESAFQAEDDTYFTSGDEEFFLEEAPKERKPASADAALEKSLAEVPPSAEKTASSPRKPLLPPLSLAPFFALTGRLAALPLLLLSLPRSLWQRFTAFSVLSQLLILGGGLVLLLASGATLWFFAAHGPEVAPATPAAAPLTEEAKAILAAVPEVPEKVRKKLALHNFLIPVRDGKGEGPLVLVQVDLTLNTLLGEEEELSASKETMARDIIYQFFANRTVAELRHYQMARGDLQRDLRAWLEKQWPDAPVESITFNRYQLG